MPSQRKVALFASLTLVAGALLWISVGTGSVLAQAGPVRCLSAEREFDLHDPIEMNTVVVDKVSKTIKIDKEIFLCHDDTDAVPDRIVDVQLFTEILERISERDAPVVRTSFEVIICEKDFRRPASVKCHEQDPGPRPEIPPLDQCAPAGFDGEQPFGQQPKDPIEMNSVVFRFNVKTIKTQKEMFICPDPQNPNQRLIVDVETFTEIIESRDPTIGFGPVLKRVLTAVCVKDFPQGDPTGAPGATVPSVVSCDFQPEQVL